MKGTLNHIQRILSLKFMYYDYFSKHEHTFGAVVIMGDIEGSTSGL